MESAGLLRRGLLWPDPGKTASTGCSMSVPAAMALAAKAPAAYQISAMTDAVPPSRWSRRHDAVLAVLFLTRLPLSLPVEPPPGAHARAMLWYPAVGALVGLAGAAVHAAAIACGLPAGPAAWLALAATVLVTGALHEDGLADVADGLGGGRDRAAKLEIMRDSRVGSYGVLALVFSIGLRAAALTALGDTPAVLVALVVGGAWSRAVLPLVMAVLHPARTAGVAAAHGRPPAATVAVALLSGALPAVLLLGPAALAVLLAGAAAAAALAWLAVRQIGGYTGDVLGAMQQLCEGAVLLTLVAIR